MAFGYYGRLSSREQAVYRASDAIVSLALPRPEELRSVVAELQAALAGEQRLAVAAACASLARALTDSLRVPAVAVEVLAVRPTMKASELHGLYTHEPGRTPRIQVWMRTAHHRRVVAFRTFLRTLMHELVHHLDYVYLKLPESYHTEGFFKRESSLVRQLVG